MRGINTTTTPSANRLRTVSPGNLRPNPPFHITSLHSEMGSGGPGWWDDDTKASHDVRTKHAMEVQTTPMEMNARHTRKIGKGKHAI